MVEPMLPFLIVLLQFATLPPGEPAEQQVLVQAPGKTWGVAFEPEGFEFGEPEISSDGTRVWVAGDGDRGLIANLILQPAGSAGDSAGCRAQSDAKSGRTAKRNYRLEHGENGPLLLTSYIVPEFQGVLINQRHVLAFLYRDGYCIQLELSMPRYKSRFKGAFGDALNALQVVDLP
jgi:hypothetical protein